MITFFSLINTYRINESQRIRIIIVTIVVTAIIEKKFRIEQENL